MIYLKVRLSSEALTVERALAIGHVVAGANEEAGCLVHAVGHPGDAAVIGQSGNRSCGRCTDARRNVKSQGVRELRPPVVLADDFVFLHAPLTRHPVQDVDPGPPVREQHSVPAGTEGQPPPRATRHLTAPAVQQSQGVSLATAVLPHGHPSVGRAAEHQRTLALWRASGCHGDACVPYSPARARVLSRGQRFRNKEGGTLGEMNNDSSNASGVLR